MALKSQTKSRRATNLIPILLPPRSSSLLSNCRFLLHGQSGSPSNTSLEATKSSEGYGGWVLTLFFWRRLSILDLAAGNVDHELGELGGVAGALAVVSYVRACRRDIQPMKRAISLPKLLPCHSSMRKHPRIALTAPKFGG